MTPYTWLQSPDFGTKVSWRKSSIAGGVAVEVFFDDHPQAVERFGSEEEADQFIEKELSRR